MKTLKITLVGALAVGCALSSLAETTWYQKAEIRSMSKVLTDLSFWTADGQVGSGKPSANDNLIAYNNWRIRLTGETCPAKSLQLGTLSPTATKSEVVHDGGVATFTNDGLKLVKGGWWFNSSGGGLTVSGPITVLSPKTDPFGFFSGQEQYCNRIETFTGPITGDKSSGLIFGKTGSWVSASNTTFNLTGDISAFEGTFFVKTSNNHQDLTGNQFGSRLYLPAATSPCSVVVEKGCSLSTHTAQTTSTVASVSFAAGTTYEPKSTSWIEYGKGQSTVSCLRATESLTVEGPVVVYYNGVIRGTGLFRLPILMGPAESTFTVDDFKLVKQAPCYNLDLHLEVGTDPETGMKALYLVCWGFVYMSGNSYSGEGTRDDQSQASSLTNAAAWWDGQVPHAGSAYRIGGKALRTLWTPTEDYAFPGESLWLQDWATFTLAVKSFSVPTFYTSGGNTIVLPMGLLNLPVTLRADRFNFQDTVTVRVHAGHALVLDGPIDGDGVLRLQGTQPTGTPQAYYELRGMNTNFTGTITVTQDEYREQYVSFDFQFPTLYVNDGRNLGGRRAAFTPRALTLTHMARLSVTNDATVTLADDLNRGVYVYEKGRFHAQNATTVLDVRQPVVLSGHLWTEGNGTVALGGAVSFEETDGGTICDVPRAGSNLVTVASAKLKAAHPDCLNGCDVTFDAGSQLVLDADKLGATGLKLTRAGSIFRLDGSFGGKLPVTVVTTQSEPEHREAETLVGLVTVPDGAMVEAVRAMMPAKIARVWPRVAQRVVELHDAEKNLTTFALSCQNRGAYVIVK